MITGNAGNNIISGNGGADTLIGGAGDVLYSVNNTGVTIVENSGEGPDWVLTALDGYTVAANVEIGHIAYHLGRTMCANNAGSTLIGNVGNDTLVGSNGVDGPGSCQRHLPSTAYEAFSFENK